RRPEPLGRAMLAQPHAPLSAPQFAQFGEKRTSGVTAVCGTPAGRAGGIHPRQHVPPRTHALAGMSAVVPALRLTLRLRLRSGTHAPTAVSELACANGRAGSRVCAGPSAAIRAPNRQTKWSALAPCAVCSANLHPGTRLPCTDDKTVSPCCC